MTKQVKLRRGTSAQHDTFIGAMGELTAVTDKAELRLHDGVTIGGIVVSNNATHLNIRDYDVVEDAVFNVDISTVTAKDPALLSDTGTDNTAAIQLAINEAIVMASGADKSTTPKVNIDLNGAMLGISSPLTFLDTSKNVSLVNGTIFALPSFAGEALIIVGGGDRDQQTWHIMFDNLMLDARWRTNCLYLNSTSKSAVTSVFTYNFTTYGIKTNVISGELFIDKCSSYEMPFAVGGKVSLESREGYGFWFKTADWILTQSVAAVSRIPIYCEEGYNHQVSACHFWVGNYTGDDNDSQPCIHTKASGGSWTNIYLDEGIIVIEDAWYNLFNGIAASGGTYGTTGKLFALRTSEPDTTGLKLTISNVTSDRWSNTNQISYSTTGSGSWHSNILANIGHITTVNPTQTSITNKSYEYNGRLIHGGTGFTYKNIKNNSDNVVMPALTNASWPFQITHANTSPIGGFTSSGYSAVKEYKARIIDTADWTAQPGDTVDLSIDFVTSSNGIDYGSSNADDSPWKANNRGGAYTRVQTTDAWSTTSMGTRYQIMTTGTESDGASTGVYRGVTVKYSGLAPTYAGTMNLGTPYYTWANIYSTNAVIQPSDERVKTTSAITDTLLDAWEEVDKVVFKYNKSIEREEEGGEKAHMHIGVIAQDIINAFAKYGLDANDYALLSHDVWEDKVSVVSDASYDEDGVETTPAVYKNIEAGDQYGVRYSEISQLDTALAKRTSARLQARLDAAGL